jgi:methylamine utilization protein MauE
VGTAAQLVAGAVLLWAAASKVRLRHDLPDVLGAYGVPRRARPVAAYALIAAETVVGVALLAQLAPELASLAALGLGALFVAAPLSALARGVKRIRCGCFGAAERPTVLVLARGAGFAALAALAVWGDGVEASAPGQEALVLVALAVLAVAVLVLGALVLALYRQVGVLTLRLGPRAALEVPEEGPDVGRPAPPLAGLERRGPELVAFLSEDCRLCRELAPSVRALAREGLAVRIVDEAEEPKVYERWNVPGSPFVVHLVDGVVGAKGLVNTLEQLDGLIAAGTARRAHAAA